MLDTAVTVLCAMQGMQGMPRPNMAFNMGGLSRPGMPHPGQMSPTMMASGMPVIPSLQVGASVWCAAASAPGLAQEVLVK